MKAFYYVRPVEVIQMTHMPRQVETNCLRQNITVVNAKIPTDVSAGTVLGEKEVPLQLIISIMTVPARMMWLISTTARKVCHKCNG